MICINNISYFPFLMTLRPAKDVSSDLFSKGVCQR
jgi:hypothetical protein